MKEFFAIASLVVSVGANIPYIRSIVYGKVKPERISWLLWTLLGATYYFSSLFADGATYFTFGELIGPVIIFGLSIKFGVGGKSRFDLFALAIALIAFCLLFILEGVLVSLILALIIDGIGVVLTVRKLLIDPASESKSFWALAALAAVLAVLSLNNYNAETLLFPVYVLIISVFIVTKIDPSKETGIKRLQKL